MLTPDYVFDPQRLAALLAYNILDTSAEQGFDDIASLAAQLCATPIALVSFVAGNRQWFKARVGSDLCETDLGSSVCAHALEEPGLLIIEDLSTDPRSQDNPLVCEPPHIRFYAGAPLRTSEGDVLGSLCAIDTEPRVGGLTVAQCDGLKKLARQVMTQLELRRALRERDYHLSQAGLAGKRRTALVAIGDILRAAASRSEAIEQSAKIVGECLDLSRVGLGWIDDTEHILDIENDWSADGSESLVGQFELAEIGESHPASGSTTRTVVRDLAASPGTPLHHLLSRFHIRALANIHFRDRRGRNALFFSHSESVRDWSVEDITFLRNAGDRLLEALARLEAEETQNTLNLELSHRLKNTLATVQAIARQTLSSVPDREPVEAFILRLQALSHAHDVLLQKRWSSADVNDIVTSVLGACGVLSRISIDGPTLKIGSRATLSLSLLLHELSTNAMKHGALTSGTGHVNVVWRIAEKDLVLEWRESGGPPANEPTSRGFGSKLIKMGMIGTGGVSARYLSTGFEADFVAPLSQVQRA